MKDNSRFYSSLGLLILLNAVIKPLWIFGIDRQVQNIAGTEVYGIYFSVFGLSIVLGFLLDWGITTFFNKQLAADVSDYSARAGAMLRIKISFALVYAAAVILIAWLSGVREWTIVLSIIGIQVLSSFFIFFRAIITARQWFGTDAWLSVLDKTLMIVFCGIFLVFPAVFGKLGIHSFLYLQLSATLLAVLAVLIILVRKKFPLHISAKPGMTKSDFKAALPFAIIVLLMGAHNRLDGFLLERLRFDGAYQAGIYASAYRLLDATNMVGYLLASFLLPYIARRQSRQEDFGEVVLNGRHLLLMISIFISFCAIFLAPQIQSLLYHSSREDSNLVIQTCLPSLLGYALVQVYGTVLTATGNIRIFCFIVLGSLVINMILNLVLIPAHGAIGSCLAALVSQGICGLACLIACNKKLGLSTGLRSGAVYLFMALLLYIYFYLAANQSISPWLQISGAGLLILIIAFAGGLANAAKLKLLFKQFKNQ